MVLLGLRATLKEDIEATAAEMVYGQNLQLPGAFFDATESPTEAQLVQALRHHCQLLRPSETAHHDRPRIFVPKSLAECDWVILRIDSQRRPFQQPYEGPFRVISRTQKTMTLKKGKSEIVVGIDRVKPAFLHTDAQPKEPTTIQQPPTQPQQQHPAFVTFMPFLRAQRSQSTAPTTSSTTSRASTPQPPSEPPPTRIPVRNAVRTRSGQTHAAAAPTDGATTQPPSTHAQPREDDVQCNRQRTCMMHCGALSIKQSKESATGRVTFVRRNKGEQ